MLIFLHFNFKGRPFFYLVSPTTTVLNMKTNLLNNLSPKILFFNFLASKSTFLSNQKVIFNDSKINMWLLLLL